MPHHERRSLWPSALSARAAFFRERSHLKRQRFHLEALCAGPFWRRNEKKLIYRSQVLPAKTVDIFGDSASQGLKNHANRDA
jgi:hypothetical protein